jgi:hypothetical protein
MRWATRLSYCQENRLFYFLHGIGQQYFIRVDQVACVACHLVDESGSVDAEITFSGGAMVKVASTAQMWEEFLAQLPPTRK